MAANCRSNNPLSLLTDEQLKAMIEVYESQWLAMSQDEIDIYYPVSVAARAAFIERNGFDPTTGECIDE